MQKAVTPICDSWVRERRTAASLFRSLPNTPSQPTQAETLPAFLLFSLTSLWVKVLSAKCTVLYCNSLAKLDGMLVFLLFLVQMHKVYLAV